MPLVILAGLNPDGTTDASVDINPDQIARAYTEGGLTKLELSSGTLLIVNETLAQLRLLVP